MTSVEIIALVAGLVIGTLYVGAVFMVQHRLHKRLGRQPTIGEIQAELDALGRERWNRLRTGP